MIRYLLLVASFSLVAMNDDGFVCYPTEDVKNNGHEIERPGTPTPEYDNRHQDNGDKEVHWGDPLLEIMEYEDNDTQFQMDGWYR